MFERRQSPTCCAPSPMRCQRCRQPYRQLGHRDCRHGRRQCLIGALRPRRSSPSPRRLGPPRPADADDAQGRGRLEGNGRRVPRQSAQCDGVAGWRTGQPRTPAVRRRCRALRGRSAPWCRSIRATRLRPTSQVSGRCPPSSRSAKVAAANLKGASCEACSIREAGMNIGITIAACIEAHRRTMRTPATAAAAGIVKVISGERRAPVRQHTNKLAAREVGLHPAFDQVGQAETLQCGLKQGAELLNTSCPSTRTLTSRPFPRTPTHTGSRHGWADGG